jgi:arabinofuranosyltransferase
MADTIKHRMKHINTYTIVCIGLMLLCVGFIIHRAWLCDDSYITFRTLDNFVNGFRLTWNTYERVQGFTHPFWLFLLIPIYAVTKHVYLTVIGVSVMLAASALVILYKSVENKKNLIIPFLILAFSNAFIDYSTSGLENSLLNLLFAICLSLYFKEEKIRHFDFWFYFISSLVILTRMDTFLILLPAVIFVFFTRKASVGKKALTLLVGFAPAILWELFSLFYFGFPFPNTFYSKLTAGFPLVDYLIRGSAYLFDTITRDPVTFLGLLLGAFFLFIAPRKLKPISIGILLYFFYVIYIGGDFMSGRMYASLLFVSVFLFAQYRVVFSTLKLLVLSVVILILGFLAECPSPFLLSKYDKSNTAFQIVDERRAYSYATGLFRDNTFNIDISLDEGICGHCGLKTAIAERESGIVKTQFPKIVSNIGFLGYYAGPDARIIDTIGLTDALLARLPATYEPLWRVGHLYREVPEGYALSIYDQSNHLRNPNLEEYNSHLIVLTQASLFSKGRLLEILRFNLGYYNYLLEFDAPSGD